MVISSNEVVCIGPTPIILSYIAEMGTTSSNDITKAVYDVSNKLNKSNVRVNAIFRGDMSEKSVNLESETVKGVLWYWLSNGFLRQEEWCGKEKITVEKIFIKTLLNYKIKNLNIKLDEYKFSTEDKSEFIQALQEVIEKNRCGERKGSSGIIMVAGSKGNVVKKPRVKRPST